MAVAVHSTGLEHVSRAPSAGRAGADLDRTFGLLLIGNTRVALAVSSIREVVGGEPNYDALPIEAEGLLGAIDVRGTIIPVLDLRATLGCPEDEDDSHVIVILRSGGYLIGVRANGVLGIVQVRPDDLWDLAAAGSAPSAMIATQAFVSDDKVVTVLDPARIADRPDFPKVVDKVQRPQGSVAATSSETFLLFSHAGLHLGIDADCVDATVPDVAIVKSAMTTGFCLGTIEHRGYNVPVVDTTAVVGLGTGPQVAARPVIVIRFGEKTMLGLAIDKVRDIVPVTRDAILAMPMLPQRGMSLFRGMLLGQEEPHHILLAIDKLRLHPELIDLAHLCRPQPRLQAGGVQAGGSVSYHRAERFMTYLAGGECATHLRQITEVLVFPANLTPFVGGGTGILGLFVHRRRLVPLICLRRVLTECDQPIDVTDARVLFVEAGDRSAGFVVEALGSIETADPGQWSSIGAVGQASLMGIPFVMLGDRRRMVSHVDLAALIERVYSAAFSKDEGPDDTVVPLLASA